MDSDSGKSSTSESGESDSELQIALQKGLLKTGLNYEAPESKQFINNVEGLKQVTRELHSNLPWIERMEVVSEPAPAPRPIADQLGDAPDDLDHGDSVHDDFKREMKFYRQAQASVLEGLRKLHQLGFPTKRPEDYFAEMAKSDNHMKKVREKLIAKQVSMERSEKAKKLREMRKYGKKVQQEVLQKRQKEKKEMMEAVKKYRKGQQSQLNFLDGDKLSGGLKPGAKGKESHEPNKRRQFKNSKFGFGGQKKRSKGNTAESSADFNDFSVRRNAGKAGKVAKGKAGKKRPGKGRRQKARGKQR